MKLFLQCIIDFSDLVFGPHLFFFLVVETIFVGECSGMLDFMILKMIENALFQLIQRCERMRGASMIISDLG
jgi:hypothetical protein